MKPDYSVESPLPPPINNPARKPKHPQDPGYLVCPFCGFDYLHPVRVQVNAGGQITTIDHSGTAITQGEAEGRGVTVRISYHCEAGHLTTFLWSFHEGNTLQEVLKHPDPIGPSPGELAPIPTIWRD